MSAQSELDLNGLRDRLKDERATILDLNQTTAGDGRPVALDQQSVGRLSRMDAMQVQAMAKAVEGRRKVRIQQIEAALVRLESGDYGACLVCGEDIGIRRLELDPAVTHCIDCKN